MKVEIVWGVLGFLFLVASAAFGHVALWHWPRTMFDRPQTAMILGVADFPLAMILAAVSAWCGESLVERQARAVRDRALLGARQTPRLLAPNVAKGLFGLRPDRRVN